MELNIYEAERIRLCLEVCLYQSINHDATDVASDIKKLMDKFDLFMSQTLTATK